MPKFNNKELHIINDLWLWKSMNHEVASFVDHHLKENENMANHTMSPTF
jgi:hypothetical protein